jgi:hypothetical protein
MLRLLSTAAVALVLFGSAQAGPLFGGMGGTGENDPGRIPSNSDSPLCNSCDIDPHERIPRSEPDPQPAEPPEDVGGAGGGQPGYIQ